ncbi:MAG: OB-fold domain-containing protein [Dehalococcoidia bacterium]|nr:OB-fold domain-containing protein [Dehalococcoidia bacterium]
MTTAKRVAVAEGLFAETPEGPRLLGSKCAACSTPYFPKSSACRNPDCRSTDMEDAQFGPRGTLWSYSIQYYPPPPPAKFDEPYTPYALGLIDLPEGLRVLARIATDTPEEVSVGSDVELVLEKLYSAPDGNDIMTWMFRPA